MDRLSPTKVQTAELPISVFRPGTYRIFNQLTGSVVQISDHNPSIVVTGKYAGANHQHWDLQPSGDGFIFKNREHGSYLAVCSTILNPLAYAGRHPTTFALFKTDDGYLIQIADDEPVLYTTGNQACQNQEWFVVAIGSRDGDGKTWRFDYVGQNTGNGSSAVTDDMVYRRREVAYIMAIGWLIIYVVYIHARHGFPL